MEKIIDKYFNLLEETDDILSEIKRESMLILEKINKAYSIIGYKYLKKGWVEEIDKSYELIEGDGGTIVIKSHDGYHEEGYCYYRFLI
jgi:hypothetical protein